MKRAKKKGENKVEYGTISLPLPLIDKIKKNMEGTGITSVSSYVSFVLREILSSKGANPDEPIAEKDKVEIKRKLKKLGYMD